MDYTFWGKKNFLQFHPENDLPTHKNWMKWDIILLKNIKIAKKVWKLDPRPPPTPWKSTLLKKCGFGVDPPQCGKNPHFLFFFWRLPLLKINLDLFVCSLWIMLQENWSHFWKLPMYACCMRYLASATVYLQKKREIKSVFSEYEHLLSDEQLINDSKAPSNKI